MSEQILQQRTSWTTRRDEKARRMRAVQAWMSGPILPREKTVEALESVIVSGDRIVMEGDNQKQADFLSLPGAGRCEKDSRSPSHHLQH